MGRAPRSAPLANQNANLAQLAPLFAANLCKLRWRRPAIAAVVNALVTITPAGFAYRLRGLRRHGLHATAAPFGARRQDALAPDAPEPARRERRQCRDARATAGRDLAAFDFAEHLKASSTAQVDDDRPPIPATSSSQSRSRRRLWPRRRPHFRGHARGQRRHARGRDDEGHRQPDGLPGDHDALHAIAEAHPHRARALRPDERFSLLAADRRLRPSRADRAHAGHRREPRQRRLRRQDARTRIPTGAASRPSRRCSTRRPAAPIVEIGRLLYDQSDFDSRASSPAIPPPTSTAMCAIPTSIR